MLNYGRGGTIVAFVPSSQGDALKQHTLEMSNPLRPLCSDVAVIDFREPDWRARFNDLASKPVWFAMAPFGGGELFRDAQDVAVSPWVQAGIPFVRLYGDVPAYFPVKHHQHFANSINAYGHAEHMDFFMRGLRRVRPCWRSLCFP